jgi:fibronectin-binding autotransporter adhesin
MKTTSPLPKSLFRSATLALLLAASSVTGDVITQTVNENTTSFPWGWNWPVWGTPAAMPAPGNTYIIPSGFTLRTPNSTTNSTFLGDLLINTNGGTLAIKHATGTATVHLVIGPGSLNNSGGAGTTGVPPSPIAGSIQAVGNINYSASGTTTPQPRHTVLLSTLSGAGNFIIGNCLTSSVYLANSGEAYTGNWTNNGGRLEIVGGNVPLGSGIVHLSYPTNTLTINVGTDLVFTNRVTGDGTLVKLNTNTLVFAGDNLEMGGLSVNDGLVVLTGPGARLTTSINNTGILRVASSSALPFGSTLSITPNNPQTGRLELSNNVTIYTGSQIPVAMRGNATYPNSTVAIRNLSGNNIIQDQIGIQSGGGLLAIHVDAGTTLELAGGVTSIATGGRNFTLQGEGNGTVSGVIDNGSATSVALNKGGPGTWTLSAYNFYTGATHITNGVLKLGPSGSIASSPAIGLEAEGKLDVSQVAGGFVLGGNQVLRGVGQVLGNVTTSPGSLIEVGFLNNYGQLSLANNVIFSGGETNRFEIGETNDTLNVGGTITLNGMTTIQVAAPEGYIANGTYRLINYSGTLQGGGSFALVTPGSRQNFTLDTATPGQVNLVVSGAPGNITWSGDGIGNVWDVATTANWNSQTDYFYNGDVVNFTDTGSDTPEINVAQPVLVGSMIVDNTAKAYTFTNFGISTFGTLTKRGAGVLALANDGNNFRGLISIEEGTLSIGNGGSTGNLGPGNITNNGQLVLNRYVGGAALPGAISGSGSIYVKAGESNANLTLSGTNTYTGLTTIETNAAINIQNNSALGSPVTGTKVLAGGRVGFTSLGPWTVAEPLEINGDGLYGFPGALYLNTVSNLATWTGPITVGSASRMRVVNNYAQLVLANTVIGNQTPLRLSSEGTGTLMTFEDTLSIGDEAVLTKDGSGTVVLAGNSNLCGSTVINAGTLAIATTNPPRIGDVTVNGGILQIGDGGPNASFPPGLINLAGASSSLRFNSSTDLTLNKEVVGQGGMSKYASNTVVILSSNSFYGNVTTGSGSPSPNGRGAGIIELRNSYGLGDGMVGKTVEMVRAELQLVGGLTIPAPISFNISGGSFVTSEGPGLIPIRSVSGNNIIEGGINLIGGAGNGEVSVDAGSTLTIQGSITANTTGRTLVLGGAGNGIINGSIYDNGVNIPAVSKQGSGTWTLNGYNFYTGGTTIQGGTLALGASSSISTSTNITLLSNAVLNVSALASGFTVDYAQTLRGDGTVQGNVTVNGYIRPGTSVGALAITGSLNLAGETVMELNRTNAVNADLISAASIVLGGNLTVVNIGPPLQAGDTFNLFDGALSGAFLSTTLPDLGSSTLFWDTSLFQSQGILKVGTTQAPPPTILPPAIVGPNLVIQVSSLAGFNYILEASPAVGPTSWTPLETKAGGGVLTFTIPIGSASQRFFRITVQ